jgi:hypothetical protein
MGRRIVCDVVVKGVEGSGFTGHVQLDLREILIGGHRQEAQKQTIEHAEAGQNVSHDFIRSGATTHEQAQNGPD